MRRDELQLNDVVLTRYKFKAKIVSFSERYIILNTGDKEISLHHYDIIKNYGGRGNGNRQRSDNGNIPIQESPKL